MIEALNVEKMAEPIKLISPNFSELYEANIEIGQFPDGDSHVRIPLIAECQGSEVIVYHRLYPKQNTSLVSLLFILEALAEVKPKNITVVVPYLTYARQDKKKLNGEVASAFVVCSLLAKAGCKKLVTFDCHFLNQEGLTEFNGLKIENISMGKDLINYARTNGFMGEDFEVISPDMGANYLVQAHGGKSYQKVRKEYDGEKIHYRDIRQMDGDFDLAGKNVLILDDMISSGNTMLKALEKIQMAGAKKICCAATHGLFLFNCIDKIKKVTDCVYSTDTIVNEHAKISITEKLESVLSSKTALF